MISWFGKWVPEFVKAYGWQAALIVVVVLALLAIGVAWLFGVDVAGLVGG